MILKDLSVGVMLKGKSSFMFSITADSTVAAAVAKMNQHRIGCLLVTDADYAVGIFTERDVLTRVVAIDREPKLTFVREVMTDGFQSVAREASVEEAMQIMNHHNIRHLPISDGNRLCGMLSISDVTGWLLKINEIEAENLRRYAFEEYPC